MNVTIPQLPAAPSLTGDELLVLAQLGVMKSATVQAAVKAIGETRYQESGADSTSANISNVTAPVTLVAGQSGKQIIPAELSGTITLPTSPADGVNYVIRAAQLHVMTIACGGSDTMVFPDGSSATSYALQAGLGNALRLIRAAGNWRAETVGHLVCAPATAANQALQYGQFNSTPGGFGGIELPGGVIVKWGASSTNLGAGATEIQNFPVAFPAACDRVFVSPSFSGLSNVMLPWVVSSSSANFMLGVVGAATPQGFVEWLAIGH